MNQKVPNGLLELQWKAIIQGLEEHPNTINDYRKVVNLLHAYDHGKFRIYRLTKEEAKEYFDYLEKESGLSPNTIHRYEATLRSIGQRMENQNAIFRDYENPFKGLIKNEVRKRTQFTKDMFANPSTIELFYKALADEPLKYRLIFQMMMEIGLSAKDICNLKVNQFSLSSNKEDLYLTFEDKTIHTKKSINEDFYDVTKHSLNKNGKHQYTTTVTWYFYKDASEDLKQYLKDVGTNTDDRPFYLTSRHKPYTYRSLHQVMKDILRKAEISDSLTPNQLHLFGMVHSYLISEELKYYHQIKTTTTKEKNEKWNVLLKQSETMFYYLSKTGWHGSYKKYYPLSFKEDVDAIEKEFGKNFLYDIVISKKK